SIRRLSRRGLSSYAWLNDSDPTGVDPVTKRAPEPPPPPPSPEEQLRNTWVADKFQEDAHEAEKNRLVVVPDPYAVQWGEGSPRTRAKIMAEARGNLRLFCKLTPRDLAVFFKDEKFMKPIHFETRELPIKRKHRRKSDEPVGRKPRRSQCSRSRRKTQNSTTTTPPVISLSCS